MATNKREASAYSAAVAAAIRELRLQTRPVWTINEASKRTGIPRSTYVKLESGVMVADTTQVYKVCKAHNLALSSFFHMVEEMVAVTAAMDEA